MLMTGDDALDVRLDLETADGAFVVDQEGRIQAWNEAAEKITGRTAREVLGKACCDVFRGRDASGNLMCYQGCQIQTMAQRGEPASSYDLRTLHASGRELWLNVSTILVRDEEGALKAAAHLFRDVTARRELELHLQRTLSERSGAPQSSTGKPVPALTVREHEILRLMAAGLPTHTIAQRLTISRATVRNHTQSILNKLGVHTKLAAVALAYTRGLVG
jgi:PAS domain S-box-containing protein